VEVPGGHDSAGLGLGRFNLDEENPLDISVDDDQFIVEISGHISFEEMLGEELIFSVKDLLIGADNLQSSPQLVFGLGAATAGIEGTREFDFLRERLQAVLRMQNYLSRGDYWEHL
jgi:large repetitive protein